MKIKVLNVKSRVCRTFFNQHSTIVRAFIFFAMTLCTLSIGNEVHAQCSGSTSYGSTGIPCSGQINTIAGVPHQRYIKVNMIKGVNYTFSSSLSGITLLDDANNPVGSTLQGNTISYTSTFSGLIRVYNCYWVDLPASLSYIANNTGSNTQDSQSACGTNNWIGHIYSRMDTSTVIPPNNNNAFSSYIGYINRSEVFSDSFGGNPNCFITLSTGNNVITTNNDFFAAKFCNQSVKPAGAYVISAVTADDGIRMYADGILVFDLWNNQLPANYTNILFQHSGHSKLELHYFESIGQNILNLGPMTRVDNQLTSNLYQSICLGDSPGLILGTDVLNTAPINGMFGYLVTYQWQVSANNVIFSDIAGANSQNYTPNQSVHGSYYFRRLATVSRTNPGSIVMSAVDISLAAQLVINNIPGGAITGEIICEGIPFAHLTYISPLDAGPYSLIINGITYPNVYSGVAFNVTVPFITTIYNLTKITDINGCINP